MAGGNPGRLQCPIPGERWRRSEAGAAGVAAVPAPAICIAEVHHDTYLGYLRWMDSGGEAMNSIKSFVTPTAPRLRCWVEGQSGPPVLLIMGFGMRGEVWRPQVDCLRANHRAAYYDARGIGQSGGGFAASMRTQADDALRVMDAIGWDRAHVVGVSMGGMVAQELALMARERLLTLSLIVTHSGGVGAWFPSRQGLRLFLRVNTSSGDERVRAMSRLLYPCDYRERALGEAADRLPEMLEARAPASTALGQLIAVLRHNASRRLRELQLPTLVVKAEQDILIRPRHSDRLAGLIRGARQVSFPEAGHGVIHQHAEQVAGHLMSHFSRVSADGA